MAFLNSLDVLIGLIVIYLTLALACTVINEWIDATLHVRAGQLRNSIAQMLSTTDSDSLWNDFYGHPLIKGLVRNTSFFGIIKRKDKPTYISSVTFRRVLMDVLKKLVTKEQIDTTTPFSQIESTLKSLPESAIKQRLITIIEDLKLNTDNAAKRLEAFQTALDQWFNESMERTSDWYKRRVQLWTFFSGIIFCTVLNVDTLKISQYLWQNPEARAAYVQAATDIVRSTEADSAVLASLKKQLSSGDTLQISKAKQQLDSLTTQLRIQITQGTTIPIGWETEEIPSDNALWGYWLRKLAGLIISIGAVSAGAPFWFDMLKNVMNIRSALKVKTIGKES
ncbi:hypothetical protein [Runella sp.]|uniref:hypothetical protein n=1 Tax=Runella sp. TaxID=1960881 RepID=UPI0030193C72